MSVFDTIAKVLPLALQVVPLVESLFGGGTGEEKRSYAVDLIVPAVRAAEAAAGRELVDEEALAEAVGDVVDGVVGLLNVLGVFDDEEPA